MITIPTLAQLKTDIVSDLENQYSITIPTFGKNVLYVFASVWAAKLWLAYKYMAIVQKNILPDTADSEQNGGTLERFGRIKLGRNPFPATQGVYTVQLTGTSGTIIPASTTWKSDDTALNAGYIYNLDSGDALGGLDIITVRALTAGLEARLQVGDTMTVTSPIAGLNRTATVLSVVTPPVSAETILDYRAKIIQAYRLEAQGGAGADYRLWASEIQEVRQSYPFTTPGQFNAVDLFIEATIADSTDGKGSASSTTLFKVESNIEWPIPNRPARKPITVSVNYISITPLDVDVVINGYTGTASDQLLIDQAITDYLSKVRPFVASIDVINDRNDVFDTNKLIFIITSTVPGIAFSNVTLSVNGGAVSTYQFTNGDIPYLNSTTYNV